jgi:hypothetical protein
LARIDAVTNRHIDNLINSEVEKARAIMREEVERAAQERSLGFLKAMCASLKKPALLKFLQQLIVNEDDLNARQRWFALVSQLLGPEITHHLHEKRPVRSVKPHLPSDVSLPSKL